MEAPREMAAAEMEEHVATHLPYSDSCPHRIAEKRCNNHRTSTTEREFQLMADANVYLRDSRSGDVLPFLVAYEKTLSGLRCHCNRSEGGRPHTCQTTIPTHLRLRFASLHLQKRQGRGNPSAHETGRPRCWDRHIENRIIERIPPGGETRAGCARRCCT